MIAFALATLMSAFAVMLRPANIVLFLAWVVFVAFYWSALSLRKQIVPTELGATLAAIGIAAVLPVVPQLLINHQLFDTLSILPAAELGSAQLMWGAIYQKYATLVDGSVTAIRYINPLFSSEDVARQGAATLYLTQPLSALGTMALHIFHSLTHDFLFTYVSDLRPWYQTPLIALNQAVNYAALVAGAALLTQRSLWQLRLDAAPWVFVISVFVLTCGTNSIAAVETRFGLFAFAIAGPLAVYGIWRWLQMSAGLAKSATLTGGVIYVACATALARWALTTIAI